ncbi:hypothetical protein [Salinicoccus kekensis]|uniref:Uncharacterized protein n=1 Tax=Salinicoccus kekensis TaxID=714307 RepID=A0A285UGJ4_9STAP|nr:hypothetical protein [Salinicoccus kekensis]SOC39391.1 hypothetical protein SAMN05878391_0862 [Salinicoccus kekensis]
MILADKRKVHPEKDEKKNALGFSWIVLIVSVIVLVGGFIWLLL